MHDESNTPSPTQPLHTTTTTAPPRHAPLLANLHGGQHQVPCTNHAALPNLKGKRIAHVAACDMGRERHESKGQHVWCSRSPKQTRRKTCERTSHTTHTVHVSHCCRKVRPRLGQPPRSARSQRLRSARSCICVCVCVCVHVRVCRMWSTPCTWHTRTHQATPRSQTTYAASLGASLSTRFTTPPSPLMSMVAMLPCDGGTGTAQVSPHDLFCRVHNLLYNICNSPAQPTQPAQQNTQNTASTPHRPQQTWLGQQAPAC